VRFCAWPSPEGKGRFRIGPVEHGKGLPCVKEYDDRDMLAVASDLLMIRNKTDNDGFYYCEGSQEAEKVIRALNGLYEAMEEEAERRISLLPEQVRMIETIVRKYEKSDTLSHPFTKSELMGDFLRFVRGIAKDSQK